MASDSDNKDLKGYALRLPADTYNTVKNLSFFTNRSMNEIITTAVTEYLARTGDAELLDAIVERTRSEHGNLLDKLKDM